MFKTESNIEAQLQKLELERQKIQLEASKAEFELEERISGDNSAPVEAATVRLMNLLLLVLIMIV